MEVPITTVPSDITACVLWLISSEDCGYVDLKGDKLWKDVRKSYGYWLSYSVCL